MLRKLAAVHGIAVMGNLPMVRADPHDERAPFAFSPDGLAILADGEQLQLGMHSLGVNSALRAVPQARGPDRRACRDARRRARTQAHARRHAQA